MVERRPVGVHQRVAELAALVDGAGRLRGRVRGDATGEGELLEQPGHPRGVLGDAGVELAVGALQVGVGHHPGPAVAGAADVDDVQVLVPYDAVEVRVDQVEAGRGAPVAEQPRLDVLGAEGFGQQRVAEQVDLPHRQVVGSAPPGVERVEFGYGQRFPLSHGHRLSGGLGPDRGGEPQQKRHSHPGMANVSPAPRESGAQKSEGEAQGNGRQRHRPLCRSGPSGAPPPHSFVHLDLAAPHEI